MKWKINSKFYLKYVNSVTPDSYAVKLRKRRFSVFLDTIKKLPDRPLKILDVGGLEKCWEAMNYTGNMHSITLLNLTTEQCHYDNFHSISGNACSMSQLKNCKFDIVFSNSVIEHLGTFPNQKKMAEEIKQIAPYYYIQTPNFWFPLEPHFLFPFFHWFPLNVRVFLVSKFSLGWFPKASTHKKAKDLVGGIRLMKKSELHHLFPEAKIIRERFGGLTKSFIVVKAPH